MNESPAVIRADGIGMAYTVAGKTLPVLDSITLAIAAGEQVAVVGPSGAGKSTLLHILGGLQNPTRGRVTLDGEDLYGLTPAARTAWRARRIGFVFQAYHLLPELDVLENVTLPALALGRIGQAARQRGLALLDAVGLAARSAHTPAELSGGEQQRVALARALMNDPEILLADEPTGSLDSRTGALVLDYLFAFARDRARTLVVVTHNADVAAACGRTVRMRDGRLDPV